MKVKRLENFAFYMGVCSAIFALALFFVAPFIAEEGLVFNGFEVFGKGFLALFSLDFANPVILLLEVLLAVTIICLIIWALFVAIKCGEKKSYIAKLVIAAIGLFIIFIITTGFFATPVTINETEAILLDSIKTVEGSFIAKLLIALSLAFSYLTLMMLTLYAFANVAMLNIYSKNKKEVASEALAMETEAFDARKAREDAFFKECEESGNYSVYEEVEFKDPIPGLTEEIVVEEKVIEETTKIHQNFDPRRHVTYKIKQP